MYQRTITDEEVSKLEPLQFDGRIHLITSDKQIRSAVNFLQSQKVIGFDTESKPTFKKRQRRNKVALLQLATHDVAFLFRLHYLTDYQSIFSILSAPSIMKVGVAVNGDFKELNRLENFTPANFLELQKYIKNFEIENISLKKMAAIVLGGKVSKRQQRSNWETPVLSEAQLRYAATDAWASLKIYCELQKNLKTAQ